MCTQYVFSLQKDPPVSGKGETERTYFYPHTTYTHSNNYHLNWYIYVCTNHTYISTHTHFSNCIYPLMYVWCLCT